MIPPSLAAELLLDVISSGAWIGVESELSYFAQSRSHQLTELGVVLLGGMFRPEAPPDRSDWHECVADHCSARMPPSLPFCGPHWRRLPPHLRERLRDTTPGHHDHLRELLVASTYLRNASRYPRRQHKEERIT